MTHRTSRADWRRVAVLAAASTAVTLVACKDSNIPFFTAPTSVANSPAGIQNALSGFFAGSRIDISTFVITVAAGYARDGAVFTNTEPRTVTYPLGVQITPPTSGGVWPQSFQNILQGQQVLAAIPKVTPAYTAAQAAAVTGVVQTMIAYNYMNLAEAHDTLGIAILAANQSPTALSTAVCLQDGFSYISALLDSAEVNLETAGAVPPPVVLPKGFAGVGTSSGPPTTSGSFASFNRALAAKAHLEWAYAIARHTGGSAAPTKALPGSPWPGALAIAEADLDSSAMFDSTGGALAPNSPNGFSGDAHTVTHDFSAASNDLVNPIDAQIGTEAQLRDFIADVDTTNDKRFKAKFITNPNPVQQQLYNPVANITVGGTTFSYLYHMSPTPGSSIPILRNEGLTLMKAQIRLARGDLAGAVAYANLVRTNVGGLAAGSPAPTYVATRDFLMKEQRISMTWEASADRTIAIRMYGLQLAADTTFEHEDPGVTTGDVHTTVNPVPQTELNGRGGTFTTSCTSANP